MSLANLVEQARRREQELLFTELATVTHRVPTGRDARGNTTWAAPTKTTYPAQLVPRARDEAEDDLKLPHDAVVDADDDVEVLGRRYRVDGRPLAQPAPGTAIHLLVRLKRSEP